MYFITMKLLLNLYPLITAIHSTLQSKMQTFCFNFCFIMKTILKQAVQNHRGQYTVFTGCVDLLLTNTDM